MERREGDIDRYRETERQREERQRGQRQRVIERETEETHDTNAYTHTGEEGELCVAHVEEVAIERCSEETHERYT